MISKGDVIGKAGRGFGQSADGYWQSFPGRPCWSVTTPSTIIPTQGFFHPTKSDPTRFTHSISFFKAFNSSQSNVDCILKKKSKNRKDDKQFQINALKV